jgi:hypothetical protein
MDNTPMLDLTRWVRFRWQLNPEIAVGDSKYGTIHNISELEKDGIRAYTPITNLGLIAYSPDFVCFLNLRLYTL